MISFLRTILTLCMILILSSCKSAWRQPFPSAEIVYQGDDEKYEIGFVNADGSNPTKIKLGSLILGFNFGHYLIKPVWGDDGNCIYALDEASPQNFIGYAAYWVEGHHLRDCRNWYLPVQIEQVNSKSVLINDSGERVLLVDLEECTEIEVLLDISDTELMKIEGISYSTDRNTLLYGLVDHQQDSYQMISLDLTTQIKEVLAQGINPSWSPDGSEIAYVQADGIYVMNSDGTLVRQLVDQDFFNSQDTWTISVEPQPRWSPDGKWLVYHRFEKGNYLIKESVIYKVEISTGKEKKIIEGGRYPDWKK